MQNLPQQPRQWQVGDLVTIANKSEQRLIVNVTEDYFEVIAESGWWNRYEVGTDLPVTLLATTNLSYIYSGREQLYRDFVAGKFTNHFKAPTSHATN